jgi:hypothetical protein
MLPWAGLPAHGKEAICAMNQVTCRWHRGYPPTSRSHHFVVSTNWISRHRCYLCRELYFFSLQSTPFVFYFFQNLNYMAPHIRYNITGSSNITITITVSSNIIIIITISLKYHHNHHRQFKYHHNHHLSSHRHHISSHKHHRQFKVHKSTNAT